MMIFSCCSHGVSITQSMSSRPSSLVNGQTDQYQGTVVLVAEADGWKLTQFEVIDQQQKSVETALRN